MRRSRLYQGKQIVEALASRDLKECSNSARQELATENPERLRKNLRNCSSRWRVLRIDSFALVFGTTALLTGFSFFGSATTFEAL
jgi:hypothetical protein